MAPDETRRFNFDAASWIDGLQRASIELDALLKGIGGEFPDVALSPEMQFVRETASTLRTVVHAVAGASPLPSSDELPFNALGIIGHVERLKSALNELVGRPSDWYDSSDEGWASDVEGQARELLDGLYLLVESLPDRTFEQSPKLVDIARSGEREQMRRARQALEQATVKAAELRETAERASGAVSEDELTKHFDALRAREWRIGWVYRVGVVGVLACLIAVSIEAGQVGAKDDALEHWLTHLALAIPFGVLGVYFARLANGHLAIARWAEALSVQLLTVDAYGAMFGDGAARSTLLASFGERVFLSEPPGSAQNDALPMPTVEALQLAQTIVETAKAFGAPSKEGSAS